MTHFYIGIDGGGTRSRLVAVDENMKAVGRAEGGSTNLAAETYEKIFANIKMLVEGFCADNDLSLQNCLGICLGSAGSHAGYNTKLLEQIFRDIGYSGSLQIYNDGEMLLLAETKGEPGAILISGTGSIGYAVDKAGTLFRIGGWGHLIDDGGSGYRIGMDAIKAAMMDFDGRGEKTLLSNMITDFFGVSTIGKLSGYIYGKDFTKAKVAEAAILVMDAANCGDNVAISIENQAAQDLITLARAMIKRAGLDAHKMVLSGSVILRNEYIRRIFEDEIRKTFPKMQIVEVTESPEMGAAYLAKTQRMMKP